MIDEVALLRQINTAEVSFSDCAHRQLAAHIQDELCNLRVPLRYPGPIAEHFAALIYSFLMAIVDQGPEYDATVIAEQVYEFNQVWSVGYD